MRSVILVQAVVLMMIVAIATSCAATREYSSKLFTPRVPVTDSQVLALRFLDVDTSETELENWVSTDFIMGRDTISKTFALDNFAKTFPSGSVNTIRKDSISIPLVKTEPTIRTSRPTTESAPVAKYQGAGEVRSKKTREEK